MSSMRSRVPGFVKRMVWNAKYAGAVTDPSRFPDQFLTFVTKTLGENDRVLDLGCGPGNLLAALRMSGWKGHYTGVDVSEVAVLTAKKLNDGNADWVVSSIETFPQLSTKVHLICFVETLYYVRLKNVPQVLTRCKQSLEEGGCICLRIWNPEGQQSHIDALNSFSAGKCLRPNPDTFVI